MWVLESAPSESESWLYHLLAVCPWAGCFTRLQLIIPQLDSGFYQKLRLVIAMRPIICDSSSCLLLASVQNAAVPHCWQKTGTNHYQRGDTSEPTNSATGVSWTSSSRGKTTEMWEERGNPPSHSIEWLLFHFVEWSSVYLCFPRINYYLKSILLDNNYTLLLEHKYGLPSWLTD